MDVGVVVIPTDRSAPVADLARAVEERGLGSLYIGGDHTHIPVRRTTPFPLGGDLPDEYRRAIDPIVALTVAATATTSVRLGTCIYLLAQRDAIDTAKKIASLDQLCPAGFDFGVGYGWNVEEADDHGVVWRERRALVREQVLAMKSLWTDDEASFKGDHLAFDASWMWPKPTSRPHPPVIVGASPGPRTFGAIAEWADGWFPVPFWGHAPDDVQQLRQVAEDAGRDPSTLRIIVNGVLPDPAVAEPWHEAGVESVLVPLPSDPLDDVLPVLDAAAGLLDRFSSN